jgi:trehalose 6-phosphate synthase
MPTRSNLKAYQNLRSTVEDTLHSANQRLAAHGLRPIHYIHQALPTDQVVALFVAADLMLVTSLADGMNLVSKEYVACRVQGSGRLVLSLTTGAAAQLGDAWLVDAYDIEDLKRGIRDALRATPSEACERMERLRKVVFNSDAKFWADSFLDRLCSGK